MPTQSRRSPTIAGSSKKTEPSRDPNRTTTTGDTTGGPVFRTLRDEFPHQLYAGGGDWLHGRLVLRIRPDTFLGTRQPCATSAMALAGTDRRSQQTPVARERSIWIRPSATTSRFFRGMRPIHLMPATPVILPPAVRIPRGVRPRHRRVADLQRSTTVTINVEPIPTYRADCRVRVRR